MRSGTRRQPAFFFSVIEEAKLAGRGRSSLTRGLQTMTRYGLVERNEGVTARECRAFAMIGPVSRSR